MKIIVEVSQRGTYLGRSEPSAWRMVQRVNKYQPRKWSEDCSARIFLWFKKYDLQRRQGMKESQTEKDEMRQQQRMKTRSDMTRKIKERATAGCERHNNSGLGRLVGAM